MSRIAQFARRLGRDTSGLGMTELALSLPFLMMAGMWGVELSNYALTSMKVNQLAAHIADNASRVGDTSQLTSRKVYESDINDVLVGANIQGGHLDLLEHGRVTISSLEFYTDVDHCKNAVCVPGSATFDDQFIHWQRCLGKKNSPPGYGSEGDVMASGMGPSGRKVNAFAGEAVIFVEVAYDYQPLVSSRFVGEPEIKVMASFMVRDSRDLYELYQTAPAAPVADCAVFDNPYGPGGVPPPPTP